MRLNKNLGFTLPEVLVAVVMTTITVGGVMMIVSDNSTKNTFKGSVLGTSACLTEAQRILSGIKEKGAARNYVNMNYGAINPTTGALSYIRTDVEAADLTAAAKISPPNDTTNNKDSIEAGVPYANRWPNATLPVIDMGTSSAAPFNAATLRPNMLVMGYMTTLQAIYNSAGSYCSGGSGKGHKFYSHAGGASTTFATIFKDPTGVEQSGMTEIEEYVKIEPFNTQTGAIVAGCPSFEPRPPRQRESQNLDTDLKTPFQGTNQAHKQPVSGANIGVASYASTMASNRGYLVTATVTFKDRVGRTRECSAQERFQYNMQTQGTMTLTMNDIDTTGTALAAMVSGGTNPDSDTPEDLGGSVISSTMSTTVVGSAPSENNFSASPRPIYPACTSDATAMNAYRTLNLRVTGVRAGSIMMCRSLLPTGIDRVQPRTATTGGHILNVGAAHLRQMFYSSELMRTAFYTNTAVPAHSTFQDRKVAGILYPSGNYYCMTADGCDGAQLPYFPAERDDNLTEYEAVGAGATYTGARGPIPTTGRTKAFTGVATPRIKDPAYKWEPCEKVSVCGQQPTRAHYIPASGTANTNGAYHLVIGNVPNGCDVNIQIAEVDAAFNITTTEFRTYMQERVPGNKLCYVGDAGGRAVGGSTIAFKGWFFYCGGANPAGYANCPAGTENTLHPSTANCCIDFPISGTFGTGFDDPDSM